MERKARTAALGAAIFLAIGSVARAGDDPFLVPREEIKARVHTIALDRLSFPKGFPARDSVRAEYERLVGARLESAGFRTVPSDSFFTTKKALLDSLKGLYNPVTGGPDSTKIRALESGLRTRLRDLGADAVLHMDVLRRRALFSEEKAKWDGTSEDGGQGQGFLDFLLGVGHSGSLGALSLSVRLEDANGATLYRRYGGIQLTGKLEKKQFVDVPEEDLLRSASRNEKAVKLALEPLVKK